MIFRTLFAVALLLCLRPATSQAQTVEKVADLNFTAFEGFGFGGYNPYDRFTVVGTNLWFTTERGGTFDAGTISRFDLVTRQIVQVASLDNNTGKNPEGDLLVEGDSAWFTTTSGGTGNRGTIAKVHLQTGNITVHHDFPTNGLPTGRTAKGGFTKIGHELWFLASSGGASNRGTMAKYNLTNGTTTAVHDFDGPLTGAQPFEGLTVVGNHYYFTTFTGGTNSGTGFSNGGGTLGRLSFDQAGNPVITKLLDLPTGATAFPAHNPLLVGSNHLYFTTVGNAANPGSIVRYELSSGHWTNVFSFQTNQSVAFGKQPYGGLVEWNGELYFTTLTGGTSNRGVIAKFNCTSHTVTKLADLERNTGLALGGQTYTTGTLVEENGRSSIYFPATRGGVNDYGTILRVALPAPPIALAAQKHGQTSLTLTWSGGYGPFQVQQRHVVGPESQWENVGAATTNRSVTLLLDGPQRFYRVAGE